MRGGATVEQAARQSGAAVATIHRWRSEEPAFNERVRVLRRGLTDRAAGILAEGMCEAARTLRGLLKSKSEHIRLKAADALLSHGQETNALSELQAEVDALKADQQRRLR